MKAIGRAGLLALFAANVAGSCDGTVNNDDVVVATTIRASVNSTGGNSNGAASAPSLSADGRFVAFVSTARDVHPDDTDLVEDVFVRDLQTGVIVLVSRNSAGVKANGPCTAPSISGDGQRVAFVSTATNLHPDDSDTNPDIYLRDLSAGITFLASRASGAGGPKGNGSHADAALSLDGTVVAFSSTSTNLPDDADATDDVFARNLATSTTVLVSRATGPAGAKGNGGSRFLGVNGGRFISADGRFVCFRSAATNLDADDADANPDLYVRDISLATTTLVSRASGPTGVKANAACDDFALSADGATVAFQTSATNLHPDDTDGVTDLFARNLTLNVTVLVSRGGGGAGPKANDSCFAPSVSGDGRYVAFWALASNLVPGDTNGNADVFVRDIVGQRAIRVSVRTYGAESTGDSVDATISADGAFVAFRSFATNLVDDDNNGQIDVFVRGPIQ